jgi:hypothetical protein
LSDLNSAHCGAVGAAGAVDAVASVGLSSATATKAEAASISDASTIDAGISEARLRLLICMAVPFVRAPESEF